MVLKRFKLTGITAALCLALLSGGNSFADSEDTINEIFNKDRPVSSKDFESLDDTYVIGISDKSSSYPITESEFSKDILNLKREIEGSGDSKEEIFNNYEDELSKYESYYKTDSVTGKEYLIIVDKRTNKIVFIIPAAALLILLLAYGMKKKRKVKEEKVIKRKEVKKDDEKNYRKSPEEELKSNKNFEEPKQENSKDVIKKQNEILEKGEISKNELIGNIGKVDNLNVNINQNVINYNYNLQINNIKNIFNKIKTTEDYINATESLIAEVEGLNIRPDSTREELKQANRLLLRTSKTDEDINKEINGNDNKIQASKEKIFDNSNSLEEEKEKLENIQTDKAKLESDLNKLDEELFRNSDLEINIKNALGDERKYLDIEDEKLNKLKLELDEHKKSLNDKDEKIKLLEKYIQDQEYDKEEKDKIIYIESQEKETLKNQLENLKTELSELEEQKKEKDNSISEKDKEIKRISQEIEDYKQLILDKDRGQEELEEEKKS